MTLMPLVLPTSVLPIRISLDEALTGDELLRLCEQNELFHIEREPDGTLLARKIGGTQASTIALDISAQLYGWAEADGRGKAYSNAGFILPDCSMRGPRLAWVSNKKMKPLTQQQREGFAPVCPEFVIEILSWNYSLPELQDKMRAWIANGVEVAWLIDPNRKAVEVYRPSCKVEVIFGSAVGVGPVVGLVLETEEIWR